MMTCLTGIPDRLFSWLATMSPAPAAIPWRSGVLPADVRASMCDLTVEALDVPSARSTEALLLPNLERPT